MPKKEMISVVIPYYKSEASLNELYERLRKTLSRLVENFEIILIDDHSPDNGWATIMQLNSRDQRVRGLRFSRNFGQHYAISAGLDYAQGDWVVVMDCDLQDQPEEIEKLYAAASRNGYDVVFGRRYKRKDTFLKRLSSDLFYVAYDYLTDSKVDNSVANFSILNKIVVQNFRLMKEHNRSFPLFIRWMGFNVGYVDIEHAKRAEGKSSYNLRKLLKLSVDSVISQSNKPLRVSIKVGFSISLLSMIYAVYLIYRKIMYLVPITGWTSVMVSLWFIAGLVFANMGIIGLYLGKVFDETKNRPIYIIKERAGIIDGIDSN